MKTARVQGVSAVLLVCGFALINWIERRRPLRRAVEPKLRREARNLAMAGMGSVALQLAERPLALLVAGFAEQRRVGLLRLIPLPGWLELAAALLLMDYTMYIWHVLTHRVPFLWRFHLVHHVDLDLDASTALRFHFGELLASAPFRAAQIALIGLAPSDYLIWQSAFIAAIMFHHSDMRLPIRWERRIVRLLVTPRMHGIHHSIVREETDSNWSSGLTIWDRLHRTLRLDVPQKEITIGVPAFRDPDRLTLPVITRMPFEPIANVWVCPDGSVPAPHPRGPDPALLLP